MKKRFITMLFSVLMMTSILSGCNSSKSKKIKLKIGFWPESTQKYDVAMYNEWKEKFEQDYPEYEIVGDPYTYATDTVGSKYLTNSLPTVFQTWFTEPNKLVSNKFIRPITNQIKELGWDNYMDTDMKNSLTFNNELYGIPRDGYGLGLLINIKTLGENGILPEDGKGSYSIYNKDGSPAYPTTFEEIYEMSKIIQENDSTKGIYICSANKNGGWQFSNIAWNFGATLEYYNEANNKWMSSLNCQEAINALTWIQKMKQEDLLINNSTVYYDGWYNAIESQVAMAIVGSDVLQLAKINGNVNMDDLAFVPMPTGDGTHHYSLYGGTPYVFSANASDEQVKGCLKFFEYIGRSPLINDISTEALIKGNEVAKTKNQPILPTIKPWKNQEYLEYTKSLEDQYVSVKMENYQEFFNKINENKHNEVPYGAQEMYSYIDIAIQDVLSKDVSSPSALLESANAKMQAYLDKNVNK